ncbi:hypothetical protein IAT38_006709 [Cryptococcus sp. DSM 104549]
MDPHTPAHYAMEDYFSTKSTSDQLPAPSKASAKRARGDDCDEEASWADDELEVLQSAVLHPFRPLTTQYPPGALPPSDAINELASQVLQHTGCPSPSLNSTASRWRHSEEATREKLKEVALAQTRLEYDMKLRKVPRDDRENRPGMRRLDSMDFLDQSGGGSQPEVQFSQAVRLSTSLQNSSREAEITQSMTGRSLGKSREESHPIQPQPTLSHRHPLRKPPSRSQQPNSLLQRGNSFTAEDLHSLTESEDSVDQVTQDIPVLHSDTVTMTQQTSVSKTSQTEMGPPQLALPSKVRGRLTRSQSSSALSTPAYLAQKVFMSTPVPSTTEHSSLALPLVLSKPHVSAISTSETARKDLSTSGDIQTRATKKLKRGTRIHQ